MVVVFSVQPKQGLHRREILTERMSITSDPSEIAQDARRDGDVPAAFSLG